MEYFPEERKAGRNIEQNEDSGPKERKVIEVQAITYNELLALEYFPVLEVKTNPIWDRNEASKILNKENQIMRNSLKKKIRYVKAGKNGKGSPIMKVFEITDFFKKISKNENLNIYDSGSKVVNSPKRKQLQEKLDFSSPSKKLKFEKTQQFWKQLGDSIPSEKVCSGLETTSLGEQKTLSGSETVNCYNLGKD